MIKRIFSLLLCLALCLSIFPAGAFATEAAALAEPVEELPEEIIPEEEPIVEEPPAEPVVEEPPEEEPVVEESPAEPVVEEPPAEPVVEELPAAAVEVTFACAETADLSALTVYDASGAPVAPEADAATGEALYGTYSLLPGEYSYSFSAEGFKPLENVPFTVEETALTFTVVLTPLNTEEEPSAEEAAEEETPEEETLEEEVPEEEIPKEEISVEEPQAQKTALTEEAKTVEPVFEADPAVEEAALLAAPLLANDASWLETVEYVDENGSTKKETCIHLQNFDQNLSTGWYVVEGGTEYAFGLKIEGDVHLILKDGCNYYPVQSIKCRIDLNENANLTIYGQKDGTGVFSARYSIPAGKGTLTVNGGNLVFPGTEFSQTVVNRGVANIDDIAGGPLVINGGEVITKRIHPSVMVNNGKLKVTESFEVNSVTIRNGEVIAPAIHADNVTINAGKLTSNGGIKGKNITIVGGEVTAVGGYEASGICCAGGGMIQISSGSVTATGGYRGAGIGSGDDGTCGSIQITGGTVTATGGYDGAGIGSNNYGTCGSIQISSATVTATGGDYGAGIGGGIVGAGGSITISSGTVTAKGGNYGAGIGGGFRGTGGSITISGGTVNANGGWAGAGIGGGVTESGGSITISSGTVTAAGGYHGAGIGGGAEGSGGTITISGGTVTAFGDENGNGIGQGSAGKDPGSFSVEDANLALCAGESREAAYSTTVEEYSNSRDRFVSIGPGVEYKVSHQWQTTDGNNYEEKDSETLYGVAGFLTGAKQKSYEGFTSQGVTQTAIAADGSTIVPIRYKRNFYDIVFDNNSIGPKPGIVRDRYGASVTLDPGTLSAEGYVFNGWFEDEARTKPFTVPQTITMPLGGKTLYAGWRHISHTYGAATYSWDEDQCTAAHSCTVCPAGMEGHTQTESVTGTYVTDTDATCTAAESGHYKATFANTAFAEQNTATGSVTKGNPLGHSYGAASYTWDENNCTATHTCTRCAEGTEGHTETETAEGAYTKESAATCTKAEKGHYAAAFINTSFEPQSISVTKGNPLGHSYGAASYTWDENNCTAAHTCTRCAEGTTGHTETEIMTGTYVKDTEATCLKAETGHYKVAFTKAGFTAQSTARGSVINGDPRGHSYGEASYTWNGDQCTATHICTRCTEGTDGHTQTETVTGTYVEDTPATCLTASRGHYKAAFTNTAFTEQNTAPNSVTSGIPLGHSYGTPSYAWDKNNNCTATHTCSRCTEGTEGHTEAENVPGAYVKDTDATCTEAEKGHYTATFVNTAFEAQTISVTVGKPLGHAFSGGWQQFGAQEHMRQCTREGCRIYEFEDHTFSGDTCTECEYAQKTLQISVSGRPYCEGASTEVSLTFMLNGENCAVNYPGGLNWYEFDPTVDYLTGFGGKNAGAKLEVGKTYVTQFLVQVPFSSLPDGSTAVPEIASDSFTVGCTVASVQTGYYEMRLTLLFTLTHANLQEAHGQPATCTQAGWKDCWHCTACSRYYEDEACQTMIADYEAWQQGAGIIPAGHSYSDPFYAWNGNQCTASRSCPVCSAETEGHTQTETVTGTYVEDTPATCLTASRGHYRAAFTNTAFTEQNTAPNSVTSGKPLGHSYGTPSYAWDKNNNCTATHICTRCTVGTDGHTEEETVTGTYVKDTDATCSAKETGHYKAAFTKAGFAVQSTVRGSVTRGEALGHSYGEASYAWDGEKCTAAHICTRCAHTDSETVKGAYVKDTDATCTEAEKGHYKASFTNTAFAEQNTAAGSVAKGDPLGHDFPETWQPYSAQQHMHRCTREGCQAYEYADHSFHGNTCTTCGYVKSSEYLIIYGAEGVWTQRSGNALPFTSNAPFDRFAAVSVDGADIPEDCYTKAEGSTKVNLLPAYLETLSVGTHSLDIVSNDGVASTTFTVKAAPVYYTVSFNMCGHGTQVAAQRVAKGSAATKPADPSASGYTFIGWYTDEAYRTKYDFRTPVNGDMVLYARWVNSTDPGSPKTGDNGQLALWAVMLSASGIALAGSATLRKKKKTEE